MALFDKNSGTHLTLFLLAEDSHALAKLTQPSDALTLLRPRLQELATLALSSNHPTKITFKQHCSLADNRKDKLSAAYNEDLAGLEEEARTKRKASALEADSPEEAMTVNAPEPWKAPVAQMY